MPRALHPVAWWAWAGCLAVAVARTTNPLLLVLALAVLGFVVVRRRSDAPWARAFGYYLALAVVVIAIRIAFRVVFGSGAVASDHILFRLPHVPTPSWYSGVRIGGPVTLEATLSAAVDGLRLGVLLCCVGAANVLANPRRALRLLPGALYELGAAVVVAITVAPQLVESVQRVRRARRLRPATSRGARGLRAVAVPVLEDAFERSLRLAAAMDSRGYGRTGTATARTRRTTAALMVGGLLGLCVGAYGLLDASAPALLGLPALAAGVVLCCGGLVAGGRRVRRSRYRPDRWLLPEWVVTGCGVATAALLYVASSLDPAAVAPPPAVFPPLPVLPVVALGIAAVAAFVAPPPERMTRSPAAEASRVAAPVREPVPL